MGKDVFLFLDLIICLVCVFNKWVGNIGKMMLGGVDVKVMDIFKKFFVMVWCFEEGGFLMIVGIVFVDMGSWMDELIF